MFIKDFLNRADEADWHVDTAQCCTYTCRGCLDLGCIAIDFFAEVQLIQMPPALPTMLTSRKAKIATKTYNCAPLYFYKHLQEMGDLGLLGVMGFPGCYHTRLSHPCSKLSSFMLKQHLAPKQLPPPACKVLWYELAALSSEPVY